MITELRRFSPQWGHTLPCQGEGPIWACSPQHRGYLSVAIKTSGGELPDQVTMGTWLSERTLALVQIPRVQCRGVSHHKSDEWPRQVSWERRHHKVREFNFHAQPFQAHSPHPPMRTAYGHNLQDKYHRGTSPRYGLKGRNRIDVTRYKNAQHSHHGTELPSTITEP